MRHKAGGSTLHYLEGLARNTPMDVANTFEKALGRKVEVATTPPEQFEEAFKAISFAPEAARSCASRTPATLLGKQPDPAAVSCGTTTLRTISAALCRTFIEDHGRACAQPLTVCMPTAS